MVLIVLADVVAPFFGSIHHHDIPQIKFDAVSGYAIGDALHFVAIFRIDVRPPDVFGGFAEEVPVLAVVVGKFEKKDLLQVGDFGGQEVAMLVADLPGRTGQMDDGPIVDRRLAGRASEESGVDGWERRSGAGESEGGGTDSNGENGQGQCATHDASKTSFGEV